MEWQVLRIQFGCDGCIYAVSVLNGWYDSPEEAERSIPGNYATHDGYSYHIAKRVCGDFSPYGGIIEHNG